MRGHGRSKPLTAFTIDQAADDLVALLDRVGGHRATPVGLSFGAMVSQAVARRVPERVAALICLDTVSVYGAFGAIELWSLRHSGRLLHLWPWEHLKRTIADGIALRPQVRKYVLRALAAFSRGEFLQMWEGVARSLSPDATYRFGKPMLIAHGANDQVGSVTKSSQPWVANEPAAEFSIIPNAGHCANQDNPDATNALLLDFLGRHLSA